MAIYSDEEEFNAQEWNLQQALEKAEVEFDEIHVPDYKGNSTNYYYGRVHFNGKYFEFTIVEMYDSNSDSSSFEVTWVDKTPQKSKELEDKIENKLIDEQEKIAQEEVDNEKAWKRSQD